MPMKLLQLEKSVKAFKEKIPIAALGDIYRALEMTQTDRTFNPDYYVSWAIFGPDEIAKVESDIFSIKKEDFYNGANSEIDNVCWGDLPSDIVWYFDRDGEFPELLAIYFNTNPWTMPAYDYGDDYYDEDDEYYDEDNAPYDVYISPGHPTRQELTDEEKTAYCKWLQDNEFMPIFNIDHFLDSDVIVLPFSFWPPDSNTLYFSLTLARYMHEGQAIVRNILYLTKTFQGIDPFVAITIAHKLVESSYNGGHCICDWRYFTQPSRWKDNYNNNMIELYIEQGNELAAIHLARGLALTWKFPRDLKSGSPYAYYEWEKRVENWIIEDKILDRDRKSWEDVLYFQSLTKGEKISGKAKWKKEIDRHF
jgi:hypothetical protein